ncbi:probable solute binding protein of ABC transporter system [Devosia sp. DBB001]|nr:probable solute binding protein of ABC transporter system [Devosia sp. DBB001]
MKAFKRGLAALVSAAALLSATAAMAQEVKVDPKLAEMVPQDVRDRGYIVGAASLAVPPLLYADDDANTPKGAVAEISAAYAARLGLELRIEKVTGGGAIPGVVAGRYDIVASAGDFKSRRDVLDFVDLVKGGTALLVKAGNPTGVQGFEDLCGRKLALAKGSIQEGEAADLSDKCVAGGKAAIELMPFPDSSAGILAMQAGRADVFWDDLAPASWRLKQSSEFEIAGKPQDLAPYGVGIPKEKTQLRDAIQASLQSLIDDGTYGQILAKWGMEAIAEPEALINGSEF